MQRTFETKNTPDTSSLYDSQTVREVLGRATQIEAQEKSNLLNADQVEALGKELGLSPDTVRRALGEVVRDSNATIAPEVTNQHVIDSRATLTKQEAKSAYMPIMWYVLTSFPVVYVLIRMLYASTIPNALVIINGIILTHVAVALFFALRLGYKTRSVRAGIVGGVWTVVLAPVAVAVMIYGAVRGVNIYDSSMFFLYIVLGSAAGGLGAKMRNWWDSLPVRNDR